MVVTCIIQMTLMRLTTVSNTFLIAKLLSMNTAIVYQEMGGTEHCFELQMLKVKYNSIQFI